MTTSSAQSLALQDFESCDWQEAFKGKKNSACISSALQKQAMKAAEEGRTAQSNVLQLLANLCSMILHPMSIQKPFHSYRVTRTERSTIPDDFNEMDVEYLKQILPSVTEAWLKARLADLLWLRYRSQTAFGLMAIDAYMETPLTKDSLVDEGGIYWKRAIQLARSLKKRSGDREKTIEIRVLNACFSATTKDGLLGRWLADLLLSFDLAQDKEDVIVVKLVSLAKEFETAGDYHLARGHYEAAHCWLKKSKKEEESFKISAALAATWETESISKEKTSDFIGAAHHLEKALQAYRQIPQKYREPFGIASKLSELQVRLNKLGPQATADMTLVSTPTIDITEMITQARESVQKKTPFEALEVLSNLYKGVNVGQARAAAKKTLETFHLSSFFPKIILSRDGRVIAKLPGLVDATENPEAYELLVRHEMIQHYLLEISVAAQGRIIPALEAMIMDHHLTEESFVLLCSQSAIVPPGRSRALGKALFAGYNLDFDSAIHRLVPQMEELVRYHLKSIGVTTSVVDQQGIEEEVNLGTLLEKPEAISIFSEAQLFEMNALFCEKTGPKFRHGLAHGLLEEEDFNSAPAIYTWCFALRLVLTPFWNSLVKV